MKKLVVGILALVVAWVSVLAAPANATRSEPDLARAEVAPAALPVAGAAPAARSYRVMGPYLWKSRCKRAEFRYRHHGYSIAKSCYALAPGWTAARGPKSWYFHLRT